MKRITRGCVLMVGGAVSGAIIFASLVPFSPKIVFNPSPSAPVGFYYIEQETAPEVGDYVLLDLPLSVRDLALKRHYLGANIPLLKQVYALAPDHVCSRKGKVFVNDKRAAEARSYDPQGRHMPVWSGCRNLHHGEIFLLNLSSVYSFDSRYFGPVARHALTGRATPLWVNDKRVQGESKRAKK